MPLVDYGSSDESDSEENNDTKEDKETDTKEDKETDTKINEDFDINRDSIAINKQSIVSMKESNEEDIKLFSKLPTPKSTFSIPDNTFKLLNKKQPVKIVLPSLSEINKSVDEKDIKKPKPSSKGSGLFALLPAPKHSLPLVPDSVKNKVKPKSIPPKPLVPKQAKKPLPSPLKNITKFKEKDDEDDDEAFEPESFFFTSTDDVEPDPIEPMDIPSLSGNNTSDNLLPKSSGASVAVSSGSIQSENNVQISFDPSQSVEFSNDPNDIDAEAIEKLCGSRARKRREVPEEIIDINVDSMVGDAYMLLSKDLTKEREHQGSFKKAKNLSSTERRKHQITYLASQAKEKEMELRNQWANSRMTRKQTQSKYGF